MDCGLWIGSSDLESEIGVGDLHGGEWVVVISTGFNYLEKKKIFDGNGNLDGYWILDVLLPA